MTAANQGSAGLQTFVSAGAALPKDDADYLIPRRRHCGLENPSAKAAREALAYFDSRHRLTGSAYDEPYWSLGDALKWITERTREAVDGASVDEEAAEKAVLELLNALAHGEVHATGSTARDPVPRPPLPATWVSHHIWLEDDGNLLWPFVAHQRARGVALHSPAPRGTHSALAAAECPRGSPARARRARRQHVRAGLAR